MNQTRIFKISLKNIEFQKYTTDTYDSIIARDTSSSSSEIRIVYEKSRLKIYLGEYVNVEEKLYEDISIYIQYYIADNGYVVSKKCTIDVFMDGIKKNTHDSDFLYFNFMNPLADIYVNQGNCLKNVENIIVSEVDAVGD